MHRRATKLTGILTAAAIGASAALASAPVRAADPFIAQITMFGGNFAPRGWAFCDGQLLPISSYTALFSLLGTNFGGDGRTTFGLPDLRGRTAVHPGSGPGLPTVRIGEKAGSVEVTLTTANMPSHNHTATATAHAYQTISGGGNADKPEDHVWSSRRRTNIYSDQAPNVTMNSRAVTVTVGNSGGGQAFNIRDPYLGIYHIIALQGFFPSRS